MGRVTYLRTFFVVAVVCAAATAGGQCVSTLRESSSGVFNRITAGVAWSGTNLGVAKFDENSARAISFATYSENLTQLTGDRLLADASFAGVSAVLWNGTEFGVFYLTPSSRQFTLQRVSASGDPIGGPIAIAPNHQPAPDREYDIVWDGTRQAYALAHSIFSGLDKGLWLTFVNRDGSTLSEQIITTLITSPASPRLAVNNAGTVAIIFRRNGFFNDQVVDRSGATGTIRNVIAAKDARIASNGTDFAVAGTVPVTAMAKEIDWAVVDEHGAPGAVSKLVTANGAEIAPVSLLWNPTRSEWALGYLDSLFGFSQIAGDYRLRRFTADGSLISDSTFSADPLQTRLATTLPFVWTGTSYVTAASRVASGSVLPASFVIRHCPLTPFIDTAVPSVRASVPVTFNARTDGGAGGVQYSWTFSDTGETRTGQTVTHQYAHTGDFNVTLTVTDASGATGVTTLTIHVITPKRRAVKR
jgi:PKD domain